MDGEYRSYTFSQVQSECVTYLWGYGHNSELREAIREAGGIRNIGISILAKVDDAETTGQLEAYYVNEVYHCLYDPDHPDTCYGYNKQTGGLTGYTLCEHSKSLISKAKSIPVAQIEADADKLVAIYTSMKIVEKVTGIPWTSVSGVINGRLHL